MNDSERFIVDLIKQGVFSIDNHGRIWRHKIRGSRFRDYYDLKKKRRAETINSGYFELNVRSKGEQYRVKAHRIVWIFFHGDIDDDLTINHINAIKTDNRPENLELISIRENVLKAHEMGLTTGAKPGIEHHNAKITDSDAMEICRLYNSGRFTTEQLAEMYPVGQTQIAKIIRGVRWKHLGIESSFRRNGASKLTWEQVNKLRSLYFDDAKIEQDLAKMYGISLHQVKRIVTYQAWSPRNEFDYGYEPSLLADEARYGEEGEDDDYTD